MTIHLKAVLPDGTVLIGPIMGRGGMIGNVASHLDRETAHQVALSYIAAAEACAESGRPTGIHEPRKGCAAIYPDFSAESDGEPVAIPLLGTDFSIQGAKR